jgi:uncharacterized DUF497 family protein
MAAPAAAPSGEQAAFSALVLFCHKESLSNWPTRRARRTSRNRPMAYTGAMDFTWDGAKSEACLRERGFDFAYAARVFFDPGRVVRADTRRNYGEDRYQVTGIIEQRLFVLVYTVRGNAIRIISARKANQREVRLYENSTNDN